MKHEKNQELLDQLGFKDSQVRTMCVGRNVWWTFEGEDVAWGFGDLDPDDLRTILDWLSHPSNGDKVFVAWNERHGTEFQMTPHPDIRISVEDSIEFPHRRANDKWAKR